VLWKQESFVVLRPLHIEFFRNLLEESFAGSVPMCSDCAFQPYCGSDPVFHYATQGDYIGHKPSSAFCARNMAIIRRLIGLLEGDEETRRILNRWIRI
jgi:hypothetical protein